MEHKTRSIIHGDGLIKEYGNDVSIRALDSVTLDVFQGEFLAITGPSGSGKTTLLNILGTLDRPTRGDLILDGENIAELNGDKLADFRRQKIGFVFQLFYLINTLTSLENVVLPILPYRRSLKFNPEQRARQLLSKLGLEDRFAHLPGQLSGGEQQRVCIARALINQPKIIYADEPTGNLDSVSGKEVVDLLRDLNRSLSVTVVMVTHDDNLSKHADRQIRMQDGRIVIGS